LSGFEILGLTSRQYPEHVAGRQREQHLNVTLEPLDEYVVIEAADSETWTRSGLLIPAGADAGCRSGIVTAVGSEADGVEVGDKVLFPKDAGYEVRISGHPVRVVPRGDLIARVHD
jgi:chaperonin GroES